MSLKLSKVLCVLARKRDFKRGWRKISSLSYMHHIGKDPLYASTIGRVVEKSAIKFEDREAVISKHQGKSLTFDESYLQADKLAAGLKALGINPGDRVGIWAPNMIEWYIGMMACARGGYIMVSLDPSYQEPEIEYAINKVGIKGLICTDATKKQNYIDILNKLIPNLDKSDPGKLNSSRVGSLKTIITIADKSYNGTYNFEEILNSADEIAVKQIRKEFHRVQTDDGFLLQYTSGTTGKPKAVLLSHFGVVNNAFEIAKRTELNLKHHKICVQVPLFHAFGTVITIVAALHFGTTLVLPDYSYNPSASLTAIKEEKCTVIHGTPTMYVDLVRIQKERKEDISPEIAVSGGAPCSPHLFHQMIDVLGVKKVKSVYGLTETTAVVFQSLHNEDVTKATTTVGHLGEHVEVKIVDENGRIVARGSPGELCVRSYGNMIKFWDDEEKTKEILSSDRWLRTGDQFILTADGYGKIVGRLKDMIIRGGENIYPKEIEDYLNTHPDIVEAQVIGVPDERLGETVCACLRLKDNKTLTLQQIREFCKGKLAGYKIPIALHLFTAFPKTASGKVQKYKILELLNGKTQKEN